MIKDKLSSLSILRRIILPLLRYLGRDIRIKHHYTGDTLTINSYLHKGYWFHGKNRESKTIQIFQQKIDQANTVIEVGGHIGYMSLLFSNLVANQGKVYVFEPGLNNLPYIRKNISNKTNVELIEKGVGDEDKIATFFMDNLTGQNNSFVEDFEGFKSNKSASFDSKAEIKSVEVKLVKLDTFITEQKVDKVDFIKIDVEGFEYEVLKGAITLIAAYKPIIMVEIQSNQALIADFFINQDYILFDEDMNKLSKNDIEACGSNNVFAFHKSKVN
jgi:FkbM family methyltransferase